MTNNKQNSSNKKKSNNKNSFPKEKNHKDSIKNNPYVQNWLSSYNESQKKTRLTVLENFSEFTEKTPSELILTHRTDILKEDPLDIENIGKKQLLAYFQYLKGEKINTKKVSKDKFPLTSEFYETIKDKKIDKIVSHNSARQYVFSKIASFFKRNNVPITFDKKEIPSHDPKGTIDKVWRNGDDSRIEITLKTEYLSQIRDSFPHLRDKAILLGKLSSGLDDIDMFNLTIGDFKRGIIGEFDLCYLDGNRKKTQMYYQTFFNSETIKMIELYLKKERKEKITNESWLFVNIKANKNGKYTKCKFNTFSEGLKVVCRKLDIKNITPKSLRRYFNTNLKNGKIDYEIRERLLGHKIDISKGSAYDEILSDDYRLTKYYSEKIEHLTLLGNGNRKITKVEEEITTLKTLNKGLEKTIDEMKEKFNETRGILENLQNFMTKQSNEYVEYQNIRRENKIKVFMEEYDRTREEAEKLSKKTYSEINFEKRFQELLPKEYEEWKKNQ